MSKTASGILLLTGLGIAAMAGVLGSVSAKNYDLDPSLDWKYDLIQYSSIGGIVLGVVLFFLGAMWFSRSK
jgi:NhaP-type Na+/H+ or K+/H+ antiporter